MIAYTKIDQSYPGYINIRHEDDGSVVILTVRADPTVRDGAYVCGNSADKGKLGRCTPGDDHCNNYCNMAPSKGRVQDHPLATTVVSEGVTAVLKLSLDEWRGVLQAIGDQK